MSCQLAVTLTAIRLSHSLGSIWDKRRQRAEHAGIADQDVEPLVTLVERERQPRNAVAVLHVQRHQRGRAAGCLDLVVELLEPADGARNGDDMRAGLRQRERQRRANAARGAGDQRDAIGEGFESIWPFSSSWPAA